MPKKVFDVDHGDFGRGDTEDDEFLRRLGELARTYGYGVQSMEVVELTRSRDETRWYDTTSSPFSPDSNEFSDPAATQRVRSESESAADSDESSTVSFDEMVDG